MRNKMQKRIGGCLWFLERFHSGYGQVSGEFQDGFFFHPSDGDLSLGNPV